MSIWSVGFKIPCEQKSSAESTSGAGIPLQVPRTSQSVLRCCKGVDGCGVWMWRGPAAGETTQRGK